MLGDVRDVDQAVLEVGTIKHFDAGTAHRCIGPLRGQLFPARPHRIFSRCPVTLRAIFLKVSFCAHRTIGIPRGLKLSARLVEIFSRPSDMLPAVRQGIPRCLPPR